MLVNYGSRQAGIVVGRLRRVRRHIFYYFNNVLNVIFQLYCGYFKHEVEANMVGVEILLHQLGYKSTGGGRLVLDGPVCPDMVAAISRDALIAHVECQVMVSNA